MAAVEPGDMHIDVLVVLGSKDDYREAKACSY